ncbi:MAG TPA: serine hydrolase domain-containing protein [Opitutaceae bacterium]|nr:serine hydrolase domain-containing protein [Opitutaceae bacterium]
MKIRPLLLVFVLAGLGKLLAAQPLPVAKPEAVGMSAERLARIGTFVERLQAENKIAGAVTVVARRGQLVNFEAHGFADLETKRPMRTDDIFAIASMTKPIAAVGVLMLVEEGRLRLSDPLEKFLPAFRDRKVAVAKADAPGGYELVPAVRSITIHDLLTQRSGFPGEPADRDRPAAKLWREGTRALPPDPLLADYVDQLATLPLNAQPGAEWRYGASLTVLGRVIEVVSGQTLDVFLRERIFAPLGMVDTAFNVPPEKLGRLVSLYSRAADGRLAKARSPATSPRLLNASGGLFSTAPDYVRFGQMLVNGGELDGHRLLGRKTIELMAATHVEQIPLPFLRGQGFGLSVAVRSAGGDSGVLGSPGTYGWGGAYNTYFRVDPQEKIALVLFQQFSPANDLESTYGFQNLVMQAVTD